MIFGFYFSFFFSRLIEEEKKQIVFDSVTSLLRGEEKRRLFSFRIKFYLFDFHRNRRTKNVRMPLPLLVDIARYDNRSPKIGTKTGRTPIAVAYKIDKLVETVACVV